VSEETRTQRVRESLTQARLVEIEVDEFPDRIKEVKHVAIGRLGELLERENGVQERESVAHSLGTLRRLEATLQAGTRLPKADRPNASTEKKRGG
jgi:hypothetical protein